MARKRAVGEGTIYRRKDGRYEVALACETTSGVRRRIRKYASNRADADALLVELKGQVHRGVPVPDKAWKLGDYLDYWLEDVVQVAKRPATYELYEATVRLHLKPALGKYSLARLSVPVVQRFLNKQSTSGKYSLRKVQIMRTVLSAALTRAMREQLLVHNVARLVELPQWQRTVRLEPWSVEETKRFLAAASDHKLHAAFLLSVMYGLRRGEVLGLRWRDVDFKQDELHIHQQLQRLQQGLSIGPVKTAAGERDFRLVPTVREALLARRETQMAEQTHAGIAWQGKSDDEALIFTSSTGNPFEPKNYNRSFKQLCRANGLREIRLHDLRHTQATLLKDLNVPVRDVQAILGHASPVTTQLIYEHVSLEASARALGAVETLLRADISVPDGSSMSPEVIMRSRQNAALAVKKEPPEADFWRLFVEFTSVVLGGPGGTRTLDTLLKRTIEAPLEQRWHETCAFLQHRTRNVLLGLVAVNSSRQILRIQSYVKVERSIAAVAIGPPDPRRGISSHQPCGEHDIEI